MDKIRHYGIVESIDGCRLKVKVGDVTACADCGVKSCCNASGVKERLIDVLNTKGLSCCKGQRVAICCGSSLGLKAVGIAFGFPFVILLSTLFLCMKLTQGNEGLSALAGMSMLLFCYLILYLYRKRLSRIFQFTLDSIND